MERYKAAVSCPVKNMPHTRSQSFIIEKEGLEVDDVLIRVFDEGVIINGDCPSSVVSDIAGTLEKLGYQLNFEKHYNHFGW